VPIVGNGIQEATTANPISNDGTTLEETTSTAITALTPQSEIAVSEPAPEITTPATIVAPTAQMAISAPMTSPVVVQAEEEVTAITTNLPEEAPPPFPEESNSKTSLPTDINAVSNIAGPTEAISPVLVIPAPKLKRPRSASRKRLPSTSALPGAPGETTPKRRRTKRAAQTAIAQATAPIVASAPQSGLTTDHKGEQQF